VDGPSPTACSPFRCALGQRWGLAECGWRRRGSPACVPASGTESLIGGCRCRGLARTGGVAGGRTVRGTHGGAGLAEVAGVGCASRSPSPHRAPPPEHFRKGPKRGHFVKWRLNSFTRPLIGISIIDPDNYFCE
jgi:hypothetical protein